MKKFAAAMSMALVAGVASASSITIKTGATFESNLADGNAYRTDVTSAVATSAAVTETSFDSVQFSTQKNYAVEGTIKFDVTSPTSYDFRAGVDLGGGGALFIDGNLVDSKSNNMWWSYGYNDASQYLASSSAVLLGVGVHTLTLYGFEDCCSGTSQVQFSTNNGASYTSFSNTDGLPAIPEAPNAALLLAGLAVVGTLARRRKQA